MLLHFWMALDRQRRAGHAHAVAAVRAAGRPGRVLGRAGSCSAAAPAWFAAVLTAFNPFLSQYAQETRMYSLVVLLSLLATVAASCAPTPVDERPARRWPVLFGLALAVALYTHNWAIFLGIAMSSRGWRCCAWRRRPSAAARLRDGLLGFGGRAAVPAVGADAALPGRAHRRAVVAQPGYERSDDGGAHRLLGHTRAARAAGRRRRRRGRARPGRPRAAADRAGPRRARRRRRSRSATVLLAWTLVAGLAGVGDPLPRGRAAAVPAARAPAGLADARRLGHRRPACSS